MKRKAKSMRPLQKSDITKEMARRSKYLNNADTKEALNLLSDIIVEAFEEGRGVQILGLMTATPVLREARRGYNPQTEKQIETPPKVGVKLQAGNRIKEVVDGFDPLDFKALHDRAKREEEAEKAGE